jgi:hypothetical protein
VTKIIEGKEKSDLIIVNFWRVSLNKSYADKHFGIDKIINFRLERHKSCDSKIKSLMRPGLTREGEKVVEISDTFSLVAVGCIYKVRL